MGRSVSTPRDAAHLAYAHAAYEDGDDFDWMLEDFQQQMRSAFPSLSCCDEWLGREDRALLENDYAHFGISEYLGIVAMWVCPKEADDWQSDAGFIARRDHWIDQIAAKFDRVAATCFGTSLRSIGHMSNGKQVYLRA